MKKIETLSRFRYYTRSLVVAIMLIFGISTTQGQGRMAVTGVVTDAAGKALPGVSVVIKGTTIGSGTDINGKYTINVPSTQKVPVLIFSSLGYESVALPVAKQSVVNATLAESTAMLDEVVVVGYGVMAKRDVSSSIASANMAELTKAPVAGFDEAMAGRLAGVQVRMNEGQPGADAEIVIRGSNSLTQDNSPLYVIDGFPMETSLSNAIDPMDIASIEVLKDASATAIYGARGANGVILVTSKKGKTGKAVLSYDGYYGISGVSKRMELLSPYEFLKYQQEATGPNTFKKQYFPNSEVDLELYRNAKGIDMQDKLFRVAPTQSHKLSLRGGSDKTKYSISVSYLDQKGIIIASDYNRLQARANIDQDVTKWLKMGVIASYSKTKTSGTSPSAGSGTMASVNLLQNMWAWRPVTGNPDYNPEEDMMDPDIDQLNDYRVNPIMTAKYEIRDKYNTNIGLSAYANITFAKTVSLRSSFGYNNAIGLNESFNGSQTRSGRPGATSNEGVNGSISNSNKSDWVNENILTYKQSFIKKHNVSAMAGFTMQSAEIKSNGYSAKQLPNESLGINGLNQGIIKSMTSSKSTWTLMSFLTRLTYDYNQKYYLTASLRSDGSSKLAPSNRWTAFPSASFMWRVSSEPFIKQVKVISDVKLRASWGLTGNNRISDFATYSQLMTDPNLQYYFGDELMNASALKSLGNRNLKWETTEQINLGLDVSLFRGRIALETDLYHKITRDLLLNAKLPGSLGFATAYKNIGKVSNSGLEITLRTINIQTKNFQWMSDFNISFNRSKVLALAENQEFIATAVASIDPFWTKLPAYISRVGSPMGQMFGFIYEGTYKYDDFVDGKLKDNIAHFDDRDAIRPGDMKYKDLNGDNVINDYDRTIIGRGEPIHSGGFNNTFSYKNFDMSIFLQWSYGNDIINANTFEFMRRNRNNTNAFAEYANRWTPENPNSNIPRAGAVQSAAYSTYGVEDGSFLRLKNVTFGYVLPKKVAYKVGCSNIRLYVTAANLLTFTGYSGMDPEVSVRNSALSRGFDWSAYPKTRTITFGLNITLK